MSDVLFVIMCIVIHVSCMCLADWEVVVVVGWMEGGSEGIMQSPTSWCTPPCQICFSTFAF